LDIICRAGDFAAGGADNSNFHIRLVLNTRALSSGDSGQ
jgi:hypothetical protein